MAGNGLERSATLLARSCCVSDATCDDLAVLAGDGDVSSDRCVVEAQRRVAGRSVPIAARASQRHGLSLLMRNRMAKTIEELRLDCFYDVSVAAMRQSLCVGDTDNETDKGSTQS